MSAVEEDRCEQLRNVVAAAVACSFRHVRFRVGSRSVEGRKFRSERLVCERELQVAETISVTHWHEVCST